MKCTIISKGKCGIPVADKAEAISFKNTVGPDVGCNLHSLKALEGLRDKVITTFACAPIG